MNVSLNQVCSSDFTNGRESLGQTIFVSTVYYSGSCFMFSFQSRFSNVNPVFNAHSSHIGPLLCKSLLSIVLYCSILLRLMWLLYIYYFWKDAFYRIVQGMSIAFFICDSLHLIDIWFFFQRRKL